jgi:SAM-dependent methyltransferase
MQNNQAQPAEKRVQRQLQLWSVVAFLVGLGLTTYGWVTRARGERTAIDEQGFTIALVSGAALCLLAVGTAGAAKRLARGLLSGLEATEPAEHLLARHPRLRLFLISFVCLFVEVMLIRYASSQVRVFSFYKNVPLIGCYLGFGLGCWLGRGRFEHVFRFLIWLIPLATALSVSAAVLGGVLGRSTATASSEHVLGEVVVPPSAWGPLLLSQSVMAAACVVMLVAVTLLFVQLGRLLGHAFDGLPRLSAYSINILGSLSGVVAFTALSYVRTPPTVWFAVGLAPLLVWAPDRKRRLLGGALAALSIAAVAPSVGDTVWSPYQKLVGQVVHPWGDRADVPPAYWVQISDVFYQVAIDLRPETVARVGDAMFAHYDAVYSKIPHAQKVLIVGSGTGNDVAAALRAGVEQVDAVDIDPAIVDLGRQHHPERPYDDPRVTLIVADARAAFRGLPAQAYDLVVFGLLDSHTQLGMSSVRLDNYVFTVESFESARRLVRPGGHIVVTAATFRRWFFERMRLLLATTTQAPVAVARYGSWWMFLAAIGESSMPAPKAPSLDATLPTDDWPFLYLPRREIPTAYLVAVLAMALASIAVLRLGGLRLGAFTPYHAHLFFLGAAFLLMEVNAVNRLALLFGTTWLVSAVTIALVLVLIVLSNLTIALLGKVPHAVSFGALFLSLVASYALPPSTVLGRGMGLALLYGLLLLAPVYFAGLVFARSFLASEQAGTALGANMLGSVLGGWSEYASMAFGMRALVLLAFVFYGAAAVALIASRPRKA